VESFKVTKWIVATGCEIQWENSGKLRLVASVLKAVHGITFHFPLDNHPRNTHSLSTCISFNSSGAWYNFTLYTG